jgi:simple sugar transport system permease protein
MLTLAFVLQGLRISVPYLLAALGGLVSERSGVVGLGLEGMLLAGALGAALGAADGGPWLGLAGGLVAGLIVGAVLALVVVRGRADNVVAGVAVNLLVVGVSGYVLQLRWGSASSSPTLPGFGDAGAELFMAAVVLVVLGLHVFIRRTPTGLRLRAAGENPAAADSLGVTVSRVRFGAVVASGALAGLGGAWLALDNRGFVDQMSGGRGYIALAALIFGRWRPIPVALACVFFGFASALQLNLQGTGGLPRELLQMLPYVLTLVALTGIIGRSRPPAGLGLPWWGR